MPTTKENLAEAFAGESQANRKYLAFAKKAEQEGFTNVASLFRTAAEAETVHAHGHFNAMGAVGTTAENLQAAVDGETYEYKSMYPPMVEQAVADGHRAQRMFTFAMQTEKVHAELYAAALEAVKRGEDLKEANFYLCPFCGHIEVGVPPESCPVCRAAGSKYIQV